MNNFYTLQYLVEELRYKISGMIVRDVSSYRKDQLDIYFDHEGAGKLTFSASSPGTALFLDGRTGKPSHNTASFFPEIYGLKVLEFELVSQADRLIRTGFEGASLELLFKPFSSRPNVFLVHEGVILASFKDSAGNRGNPAPEPHQPLRHGDVREDEDLASLPIRKRVIAVDRQFPRGLIPDLTDTCRLDELSPEALTRKIHELRHHLLNPEEVSVTAEGNLSLLPRRYLSHPPEHTFDSVNDAVRFLFLSENRKYRLLPRKNVLLKMLQKKIGSLKKQEEQYRRAPELVQKSDTFQQYGHMLMSQPDPGNPVTADHVTVSGWDNPEQKIAIPVRPGETLIDASNRYYDKSAALRREASLSAKNRKMVAAQQDDLSRMAEELERIEHPSELEKWVKRRGEQLQKFGLASSGEKQEARPFREMTIQGYEVWIGKSAKSNDELLKRAHKEDIWMHARGTAGSHVIVRNRGAADWPDRSLLLGAAACAAAYSKQSGSSLVPVMMAKRKHVRKPKGARPGEVTVTGERVEMVEPVKPERE
ncbi:NFACT RNA binding domain-containing protein [Balneolales bacterium ANBcel1]|nr:NFACT RNA binding domain-containing protein [Balneolales bacterium ANBcel1]